jgi:hypothetical protein
MFLNAHSGQDLGDATWLALPFLLRLAFSLSVLTIQVCLQQEECLSSQKTLQVI